MLIFVYNHNTLQTERYNLNLTDPMPYVINGSLTVREFRGSSRAGMVYTDMRAMQTWNRFRNFWGRAIPVGYVFKRIWEGGHGLQSQHYAGGSFDVAQGMPATVRNEMRTSAIRFGGWSYVEPAYLTPTWVHFDWRLFPPACSTGGYITVRRGSRGVYVMILQDALNALGFNTNGLDGIFGDGTHNAMVRYQQANRLAADGICGCQTWRSVCARAVGIGLTPTVVLP
ncbi:MAG: peptidoglycan-binding protein [Clostridia bacterium]|nr:peptidoglycan-binding protein [Clostridia bacterium]